MADTQYQYYESKFTGQEIDDNLTLVKDNMNNLLEKVGDNQKGLVKDVADLKNKVNAGTGGANSADVEAIKTAIGMPYTPPVVGGQNQSIVDRIEALELYKGDSEISAGLITDVSTLKTDVSTLKTDVSTLKGYHSGGSGGNTSSDISIRAFTFTGKTDEADLIVSDGMYQRVKLGRVAPSFAPLSDQELNSEGDYIKPAWFGAYDNLARPNPGTDAFDHVGTIEITHTGFYMISGGVYCLSVSNDLSGGQAVIFLDRKYTSQTELPTPISEMTYENNKKVAEEQLGTQQKTLRFVSSVGISCAGGHAFPTKLVYLHEGENLQIKARTNAGTMSIRPNHYATHLTLLRLK